MALRDLRDPIPYRSGNGTSEGAGRSEQDGAGSEMDNEYFENLMNKHTEEIKKSFPKGGGFWSIAGAACAIIAVMVILIDRDDKAHVVMHQTIDANIRENTLAMKELSGKVETLNVNFGQINGTLEGLRQNVHFLLLDKKLPQGFGEGKIIESSD